MGTDLQRKRTYEGGSAVQSMLGDAQQWIETLSGGKSEAVEGLAQGQEPNSRDIQGSGQAQPCLLSTSRPIRSLMSSRTGHAESPEDVHARNGPVTSLMSQQSNNMQGGPSSGSGVQPDMVSVEGKAQDLALGDETHRQADPRPAPSNSVFKPRLKLSMAGRTGAPAGPSTNEQPGFNDVNRDSLSAAKGAGAAAPSSQSGIFKAPQVYCRSH